MREHFTKFVINHSEAVSNPSDVVGARSEVVSDRSETLSQDKTHNFKVLLYLLEPPLYITSTDIPTYYLG